MLINRRDRRQEALSAFLESGGYEVELVESGSAASDALEKKNGQLVVADVDLSTIEVLRATQRPERSAMERAALARITAYVSEAIAKAPTRVLERALSEYSAPGVLANLAASELLYDSSIEGEWASALLQGARVKSELLEEAGGALSAQQVSEFLGIGRAAVDKRRRQGTLLGLKLPSGDVVYPAGQFGRRDVLPNLPEVLAAFRVQDSWMQLDFLLGRHDALAGRTGFEALAAGDVEKVKHLAASVGEQGL